MKPDESPPGRVPSDAGVSRGDLMAARTVAGGIQISIETTGRSGSLAVLRGGEPLHTCGMTAGPRTAATLAPELDATLRWCAEHAQPPAFVSVAVGPGSFTGLRIGVTTAKTLAYALRIPLVGVDSLAAIAATVATDHDHVGRVFIGLSAYRGQVFSGTFDFGSTFDFPGTGDRLVAGDSDRSTTQAASRAANDGRSTEFASGASSDFASGASSDFGSGASGVFDEAGWRELRESARADATVRFAGDPRLFDPTDHARFLERTSVDAVGVGKLAYFAASRGEWSDPITISPRYLRPSAAEEKATGSIQGDAAP